MAAARAGRQQRCRGHRSRARSHRRAHAAATASKTTQGASGLDAFEAAAASGHNLIPLVERIFSDQLTPVLAYRCLVREDDRDAPSFLLESVTGGNQAGRWSFVGAQPCLEVVAKGHRVTVLDHKRQAVDTVECSEDPMRVPEEMSGRWRPHRSDALPDAFCGGWVGYSSYDTVRYGYRSKLPFGSAPGDDRGLPDIHLGLYKDAVVFDNATKTVYVVHWVELEEGLSHGEDVRAAYAQGASRLAQVVGRLRAESSPPLAAGTVTLRTADFTPKPLRSNMTKGGFLDAVARAKEYIQAGDIFQVVLSQRFERRSFADPFEVYRSLRVVNPSPYMVYLQARGAICVASSPEILCRVDKEGCVVNRPLAGTRPRGKTEDEDAALESELLADEKERAEHVMLVDLGRNDVGRVAEMGSVVVDKLMEVERYSHVMHISSTVLGALRKGLSAWDTLRAALPAGTVSGAPKVRAMQIIDELEPSRRGPYGGGIGVCAFTGEMDIALALRTMVVPTANAETLYDYGASERHGKREWVYHLQAGAGVVADSDPESEYQETVNKSAALARAVDLAEEAFGAHPGAP